MFDFRYPHMHRVESAPGLDQSERANAVSIARAINGRCGTNCAYNALTGGLFFYYGTEPDFGPFEAPFKDVDNRHRAARPVTTADIDQIVRIINLGKMSARRKDSIERERDKDRDTRREKVAETVLETQRHDMENEATRLRRARRGLSTKVVAL